MRITVNGWLRPVESRSGESQMRSGFSGMGPFPIPQALRQNPFRGRDAIAAGLVSESRLRGPEFCRVLHGVYVIAGTRIDHGVRCLAASLILPEGSALTGHSAAWWLGIQYARDDAPVLIARPPGTRIDGARGIKVHRTPVTPGDIAMHRNLCLTTAVRAAWDVASLMPLPTALPIVDGLLHAGILTAAELDARLLVSRGVWGVRRVRALVQVADGRSESPPESLMRLAILQAGLPVPVPQLAIRLDNGSVVRVDFAWPEYRVALEYDGAHHADQMQMQRDRRRLNELTRLGWTVLHATASDLRDPTLVLQNLRAVLTRPAA